MTHQLIRELHAIEVIGEMAEFIAAEIEAEGTDNPFIVEYVQMHMFLHIAFYVDGLTTERAVSQYFVDNPYDEILMDMVNDARASAYIEHEGDNYRRNMELRGER